MEILKNESGETFVMYSGELGFYFAKLEGMQPIILTKIFYYAANFHIKEEEIIVKMQRFVVLKVGDKWWG